MMTSEIHITDNTSQITSRYENTQMLWPYLNTGAQNGYAITGCRPRVGLPLVDPCESHKLAQILATDLLQSLDRVSRAASLSRRRSQYFLLCSLIFMLAY